MTEREKAISRIIDPLSDCIGVSDEQCLNARDCPVCKLERIEALFEEEEST